MNDKIEKVEIKKNKVIINLDKNIEDIRIKLHIKKCEGCGTLIIANNKQKYCDSCKVLSSRGQFANVIQKIYRKYYLRAYNRKDPEGKKEFFIRKANQLKRDTLLNWKAPLDTIFFEMKLKELYDRFN